MSRRKLFRMTPQRQVLLQELGKKRWHPTADELYDVVRERMPRISLGTVYRNLEIMADQGLIRQLDTGGHQKRFDGTAERHYHVRCIGCGRLDDIEMNTDRDLRSLVSQSGDYVLSGYLLEFMGLCPNCQNRNRKENTDGQFEGNQD